MTKYIIIFLILLSVSVSAQQTYRGFEYPYVDTITSFPFSSTADSTLFVLQSSYTGVALHNQGALYFNGCDYSAIMTDGDSNYTISYSGLGSDSSYRFGIGINSCTNFIISDIRLIPEWNYTDTFGFCPVMVNFTGSNSYVTMDSMVIKNTGYSDATSTGGTDHSFGLNSVRIYGSPYHLDIVDNDTIQLDGYGFLRRDHYMQVNIFLRSTDFGTVLTTGSTTDYNVRIGRNNYMKASWANILQYNGPSAYGHDGVMVVDSNYGEQAGVNTSATAFGGSYLGDGGFFVGQALSKYFIFDNTVIPIIDLGASPPVRGGSGIFLSAMLNEDLPAEPYSYISGNNIVAQLDITSDHAYGIFTKWDIRDVKIYDNVFAVRVNANSIGYGSGGYYANIYGSASEIYNNTYVAISDNDADLATCIRIRGFDENYATLPNMHDERLESNDVGINWYIDSDGGYGDGIRGLDMRNFTYARVDSIETNQSGSGGLSYPTTTWDMYDVRLIDFHGEDGINDTDFSWAPQVKDNEVEWLRNVELLAVDSVGDSLNATVILLNDYGDTIYNSVLGADGLDTSLTKYYRTTQDGNTDSTGFNPFIGTAIFVTDTIVDTFNVGSGDSAVIFQFGTVVTPDPPVAEFSGTPTSGEASLEVTFTDASTNTPTSWAWDFGDEATSTSQNPTHTYTTAGTYTVTLTATNAGGSDDEIKTNYITVSEPAVADTIKGKYRKVHIRKGKI